VEIYTKENIPPKRRLLWGSNLKVFTIWEIADMRKCYAIDYKLWLLDSVAVL